MKNSLERQKDEEEKRKKPRGNASLLDECEEKNFEKHKGLATRIN